MSIKKIFITYIAASALIFNMFSSAASAETSIVKIQELGGRKYVSLTDLTKSYGGTIESNPETKITTYTLNGKVIAINNKTAFVSIDNNLIPLETKDLEGIKVPNFQPEKPQSDNGEVLFPVSIVENYVGIKATDKGFTVNAIAVDKEASTIESTNTNTTQSEETYYYQEPYTESPSVNQSQVTPSTEAPATGSNSNNGSSNTGTTNTSSSSGNSQSPTEPAVPQTPVEPEIPKPEEPTIPEETTPTQPAEQTTPSEQTETPQPATGETSTP